MTSNNPIWLHVNALIMFISFIIMIIYLKHLVNEDRLHKIIANFIAIPSAIVVIFGVYLMFTQA